MLEVTPKICIDGREVDYIKAGYSSTGDLKAAQLDFTIPLDIAVEKQLWNKEVTFFMNTSDAIPLFRGWIHRVKENYNDLQIHAEDGFGYMLKGGGDNQAIIALTDEVNLDGLTAGAAIAKAISLGNLNDKIKTDYIGDTSPVVSSVNPRLRGTMKIIDIIKHFLTKAINTDTTDLPRPNIAKIIDDGTNSQLVLELLSDVTTAPISHIYDEYSNLTALEIINRKVPTIIIVNGKNGVKATFEHTSAISALDRSYLEVTNNNLTSPAECQDFAQKLYMANINNRFQYSIKTFEGAYLVENSVIQINTGEKEYDGNYRVTGKNISFSPSQYDVSVLINKRPPTLAEYISSRDN
tara:strand:- start:52 stop:1107 length:1056 start_codon:yes stop_codon:yes gene_type:complete